jgi:hypothetical protein
MFPPFDAEPYSVVVATAVPRAGPVVSFFTLAGAFSAVGDAEAARRYCRLAADATPTNDTDSLARPLALSTLIGYLGSSEDVDEIQRRFSTFLTMPRDAGLDSVFASRMFGRDHDNSTITDGGQRLENLVQGMENGLLETSLPCLFGRPKCSLPVLQLESLRNVDRAQVARLWRDASREATAGRNGRVMLRSGFALGFEYVEYGTALRGLAEHQFTCLRGTELSGVTPQLHR